MKTDDVEVTELTLLDASKVSAVSNPANGTPWIVLKAAAPAADDDADECSTCKGTGKIREGHVKCPTCKGTGNATKSECSEADAQQEELTGEAAKGDDTDDGEADAAEKAKESGKQQNDLPDSAFAFIEPGGTKDEESKTTPRSKRHFPVHDEAHARNALARASQSPFGDKALPKIKSAAKKFGIEVSKKSVKRFAKALNIELPDGWIEKCVGPGVTVGALDTPKEAGHLATSESGTAGSVTAGVKPTVSTVPSTGHATSQPGPTAALAGGESAYAIPDEAKVVSKAVAVASLVEAIDVLDTQRQAIKDGKFLEATGPAAENPGSAPWESYDSATLRQVAECLAGCCSALDNIAQRERTESRVADAGDASNAWDLEEAAEALEFALGVAARLSFHEAAEGEATKSGKVISAKNVAALEAAHKHLSTVLESAKETKAGDAGDNASKEVLHMDLTTSEFIDGIRAVIKAERKAEKKAAKQAAKQAAEEAAKNANNGGDITAQQEEAGVKGETNAANVNAVGGPVDSTYVNKGEGDEPDPAVKSIADKLEKLSKQVEQFSKRPRSGGPSLDGQVRGVAPATEGRQGEVTKSVSDSEIEQLEKSLAEATDPLVKGELGQKLTYARLLRLHETGQL
jgi:hypothetical protein